MQQRSPMPVRRLTAMAAAALILAGCGSGSGTIVPAANLPHRTADTGRGRDVALQHFIDGSVYELKGDFAQAVLEYQDALRDEPDHAIYQGLARCYSALGKHTLAIEAGREAVRLNPDNLEYRSTLAQVYVAAFEIDSAAAEYEEMVRRDPGSLDSRYNLARLYQGRKPLKALEVYTGIIERFGPEWDVLLQIAEIQSSIGEHEKSARALMGMLELDPANQQLKQSIAQAFIRAGKLDTALAVFRDLQEVDPANLGYRSEIAGIYLRQKEYEKASREFGPVLSVDSVSVETKLKIGELYFQQLEQDSTLAPAAIEVLGRIRDAHPDDWRPYWFLGGIGALTGNDSLAETNFRKVTELAGWNADAWVYLSSVFLEKNDYAEVAKVLESAVRVAPDDFRVNFFLGVAYTRLARTADAIRVLERARSISPEDVNAIIQLALVYDGLKDYEETDRLYQEALRLDPGNHLAQNNYSYSLAERSMKLDEAFEMATSAVEAQPDNQSYLDTLGWVCFRLGKFEQAERFIRMAIEKGEATSVLHEHLGDVYFGMQDRERALEQWNIALRLDGTNAALREKIERGTP
jgi:tetratricopeptide (TPR) repeat protein